MNKAYIYAALAAIAVLGTGCSKNVTIDDPDGNTTKKEAKIGFGTPSAKSPEVLTPDENKPLQIKVYDYFTKEGTTDEVIWIDDLIQESEEETGAWAYAKENTPGSYSWKRGVHDFMGWVSTYADGADLENLEFNSATKKLSLSATTLPGSNNPDYMYSGIETVTWPDETYMDKENPKSVLLKLNHLSSAVTYTVHDYMYEGKISGLSVTVNGIAVQGTAEIDFSGDAVKPTPAIVEDADKGNVTLLPDSDFTYDATKDKYLYFKGIETCVWPQSVSGATVTIKYTPNGGTQKTVTAALPDVTWEQGKSYNLDLQIVNKKIELTFTVQDWKPVTVGNIDTSTGSINMTNVTWQNTKVDLNGNKTLGEYITESYIDEDGKSKIRVLLDENSVRMSSYTVMMYHEPVIGYDENGNPMKYTANGGYMPAQGFFTVNYPKSGLFKIELIPAFGEETVDPSKYQIYIYEYPTQTTGASWRLIKPDGETITNNTVYFQVRAAAGQDGAEHKAQIDIRFKPAGEGSEWISAYSEIRANYALTIEATTN